MMLMLMYICMCACLCVNGNGFGLVCPCTAGSIVYIAVYVVWRCMSDDMVYRTAKRSDTGSSGIFEISSKSIF